MRRFDPDRSRLLEQAGKLRDQYIDAMRLLDDLGWDHVDARDHFPLTTPRRQLVRTIRRHHGHAAGSLKDQASFLRGPWLRDHGGGVGRLPG